MTDVRNPSVLAQFPRTQVYNGLPANPWTWYDLDLSVVVGRRRALVLLRWENSIGLMTSMLVRRNGDAVNHTAYGADFCQLNASEKGHTVIDTDDNGVIEFMTGVVKTVTGQVEAFIYA